MTARHRGLYFSVSIVTRLICSWPDISCVKLVTGRESSKFHPVYIQCTLERTRCALYCDWMHCTTYRQWKETTEQSQWTSNSHDSHHGIPSLVHVVRHIRDTSFGNCSRSSRTVCKSGYSGTSSSSNKLCAWRHNMPPPLSSPVGALAPIALSSRRNRAVLSHAEYVPTLTAEAALCVKAALSKSAWWHLPLRYRTNLCTPLEVQLIYKLQYLNSHRNKTRLKF